MFSTRMTVATTTRPKSMAPTDSRFARFAHERQNDDREREREGDGRGDDNGASQVAQKQPLHSEDEADPEDQVPHHFLGRQAD